MRSLSTEPQGMVYVVTSNGYVEDESQRGPNKRHGRVRRGLRLRKGNTIEKPWGREA